MKGEHIMSDNPGIGKQVASSVVCITHDFFRDEFLYHVAVGVVYIAPKPTDWDC